MILALTPISILRAVHVGFSLLLTVSFKAPVKPEPAFNQWCPVVHCFQLQSWHLHCVSVTTQHLFASFSTTVLSTHSSPTRIHQIQYPLASPISLHVKSAALARLAWPHSVHTWGPPWDLLTSAALPRPFSLFAVSQMLQLTCLRDSGLCLVLRALTCQ